MLRFLAGVLALAAVAAAQTSVVGEGGGAPTDAQYWLGAANGELSAEIVVNDIASLEAAIAAYDFNDASNLTTGTIPEARIGAFSSLVNINGGFEVADMRCTASAGVMTCQDPTATTGITSVIVKGGAGQGTNSLLQLQDSSGNLLTDITDDNRLRIGKLTNTRSGDGTSVVFGNGAAGAATGIGSGFSVFIGDDAGAVATSASENVFVGAAACNDLSTGNRNVCVGRGAGASGTYNGDGSVFLGYVAGGYETGSNVLYIDNQSRTNQATGRTNALIYGTFNATPANQTLHINAQVRATHSLEVGNVGALIYPPSATEPVDCTASNDGSMYFDTTDQTMCVCANDGADEWQKIQDMTTDCSI